jgi:hypothetical protein
MSEPKIGGFVVNACFPRSGHRMLREILERYFGDDFVFYEPYEKKILCTDPTKRNRHSVNYLKTHDFKLEGPRVAARFRCENKMHLIQIRRPLESIVSYYEFSLKHGAVSRDSESNWRNFLKKNLTYWSRFYETWINQDIPNRCVTVYEDLVSDVITTAANVILFLCPDQEVDLRELDKIVSSQPFLRYVGDHSSQLHRKRELSEFNYYNELEFRSIEDAMMEFRLQSTSQNLKL